MNRLDRCLRAAALFGALFLICVTASAILYYRYQVPMPAFLRLAFDEGDIFLEGLRQPQMGQMPAPRSLKDQPLSDGKVTWNKAAFNGYTLVSASSSRRVELIDMQGREVYHWLVPIAEIVKQSNLKKEGRVYLGKALLYPNGDLLVELGRAGVTPYGYAMARLDRNSKLLWAYFAYAHHDFSLNSDGSIEAITHEFLWKPPSGGERYHYPLLNDYLVTLSPDGKELSKLSVLDAFLGTRYESLLAFTPKLKWDLLHTNSVQRLSPQMAGRFPMFKAGSLLISLRLASALAVIDPDTRKVVWAFHGPMRAQHSASFTRDGHILVFDNLGLAKRRGGPARILEIDPATSKVVWQYQQQGFRTHHFGRVQRLPNGNTLINASLARKAFEVTPQGNTVWSYKLPGRGKGILASATRYAPGDLPFLGK